jgi:hypothetical protein
VTRSSFARQNASGLFQNVMMFEHCCGPNLGLALQSRAPYFEKTP